MPQAVATWAVKVAGSALVKAGVTGKALYVASAAVYATTYAAVTFATSYAATALAVDTPDADAAQGSLKQPIPPRIQAYGRGRLAGFYMLWEAVDNRAYDVIAFHDGEIEALEQVWSHDHILNFVGGGVGGMVQYSPVYGAGGLNDLIRVDYRLGLPNETAYANFVADLPAIWTDDHRGDGIASLGCAYKHAKKENLLDDFPNGDPVWSVVGRFKKIADPRTGLSTASQNTGVQILDLLTDESGLGQDHAATVLPVIAHWEDQLDICDEPVALAAGGTVPRYQSFTYRALSDDPVDCLRKLLNACDGRILLDDDGCWRLWVGKQLTPTAFLTEDDIIGYEVSGDLSTEDVVNELVPKFKHPESGWNMVETDPWRDATDAEARGQVLTQSLDLEAVTNNSQARRVAKRMMSRMLTPLRGTLQCKLSAARVMGHRWVGVDYPELGLENVVIEVLEGGVTSLESMTVSIPFALADAAADSWNAATEEGVGPGAGERLEREGLAAPTISGVSVFEDSTGGSTGVRLSIDTTGPARDDLTWAARWRVSGTPSWVEGTFVDIDPGAGVTLQTGFVAAEELDVQTAYTTGAGAQSPWSATFEVDAAQTSPWTPNAISGAVLGWWDARATATLTRLDGVVSSWASRTGGHALSQSTAAARPSWSATAFPGGQPGVSFDGAATDGDMLVSTTGPFDSDAWVFLALSRGTQTDDASVATRTILRTAVGGALARVFVFRPTIDTGLGYLRVAGDGTGSSFGQALGFGTGGHVVWANLAASDLRVSFDGASPSSAGALGSSTLTALEIGGNSAAVAAERFAGVFGEILIIDKGSLSGGGTTAERQTLEGYLAHRWGLTGGLPSDHPYKTTAPTL